MGSSARSLAVAVALVLAPTIAAAQGAGTAPPPGGTPSAPASAGAADAGPAGSAPGAADEKKGTGQLGGYAYSDKPSRRATGTARAPRGAKASSGPRATFPGFEQLPDGGSRLLVQLSQNVPVEERRAQGSVTYVLKGAHLRVRNDANALVTVHFNTPVYRARLQPSGKDLLFVLELRNPVSPTFKVQDNQDKTSTLMIDFPKGDFITGDGSETLPSEPGRAARAGKRKPGGKGAPAPAAGTAGGNEGDEGTGPTP